jgi:hypothetical protein
MTSPASFNYYQECAAQAKELEDLALQAYTPTVIAEDLLKRANLLWAQLPPGIVIGN